VIFSIGSLIRRAKLRVAAVRDDDVVARIVTASIFGVQAVTRATAFAAGLFFTPASLVSTNIGNLDCVTLAKSQPVILTESRSEAFNVYNNALNQFKSILSQRRAQINSNQLPKLPGQELHVARNNVISAYKDLTNVLPSKVGRPNKFGFPPAYFDADNEPVFDEYEDLFEIMEAPPVNAQSSDTPFKDVIDLGTEIARAKGLSVAEAQVAGLISLGLFFAETAGRQNRGNARSDMYEGSLQTAVSEDQNGQRKWAAIKKSIAAFDPALAARDAEEEARVGNLDHRLNHWTAVRDGLMNAPADFFPQIPAIAKAAPNLIDQMKVFELIQIIPSPTRSAINSGNLASYKISETRIMRYLRNNSIFAFGKLDKERASANFGEILDAMWPFNYSLGRALSKFDESNARQ
jgi:hypothetical protein